MTNLDFSALRSVPRLFIEVELRSIPTERFQPTGFADLGHARYELSDGTKMLLVESAQSVANRLEAAVWDEGNKDLIQPLRGLPYVRIRLDSKDGELGTTTTLQEAHRLNSGYLWTDKSIKPNEAMSAFRKALRDALGLKDKPKKTSRKAKGGADKEKGEEEEEVKGVLDMQKIARALFAYDPNSILHGVFLEKLDGRMRLARAISGFIEARHIEVVQSGGVKNDRVDPKGSSSEGLGNVPFPRTEFTAKSITAYFSLDLALLRGYGLSEAATDLLIALALLKVGRFLENSLRLRTACEFEVLGEAHVKRPTSGFALPTTETLLAAMPSYIAACKGLFADPAITDVGGFYERKKKDKGQKQDDEASGEETDTNADDDSSGNESED